ncbi:MAG: hypothetical protein JWO12_2575 [Frankiales bacterium]|nr:hypothetical protein [Frankiales bacterium]
MRRWLAGMAVISLGFLATPGAVPVYDGVGQPDDPYRYAGKQPAPVAVSTTAKVVGGSSAALQLQSAETGPQVLIDLAAGAFSATTREITFSATPQTPDGSAPRGEFDGNSYHVVASPGATLRPEVAQGFLFLRAAVMTKPSPVIVHRTNPTDPWAQVPTNLSGRDIVSTPFRDLGDYAVVRLPGSKPLTAGGLSIGRVLLLGAGVLALLTITVLVLRRPRGDED